MQADYFRKAVSLQTRLAPTFHLIIDRIGIFTGIVVIALLVTLYFEGTRHRLDAKDLYIALLHVPFVSVLIYFIVTSRSRDK
jgi:hypothetical protein